MTASWNSAARRQSRSHSEQTDSDTSASAGQLEPSTINLSCKAHRISLYDDTTPEEKQLVMYVHVDVCSCHLWFCRLVIGSVYELKCLLVNVVRLAWFLTPF